jgi:hypothetical protein
MSFDNTLENYGSYIGMILSFIYIILSFILIYLYDSSDKLTGENKILIGILFLGGIINIMYYNYKKKIFSNLDAKLTDDENKSVNKTSALLAFFTIMIFIIMMLIFSPVIRALMNSSRP